jgi:hypothetical protein
MNVAHYILAEDGKTPMETDLMTWARWFEDWPKPVVSHVIYKRGAERYFISTVFLGFDHSFMGSVEPALWETMVFEMKQLPTNPHRKRRRWEIGPRLTQNRYCSHADAMEGHRRAYQNAVMGIFDDE